MMITAGQFRAARALLGLSQEELAAKAGVSAMTVRRAEGSAPPSPSEITVARIYRSLTMAGIEFIPENGGGGGVRLRRPQ